MKKLELRLLGIKSRDQVGVEILEQLLEERTTVNDLTYKQIKDVLEAWDGRNYVPYKMKNNVNQASSLHSKEDVEKGIVTQEQYDRSRVEQILQNLRETK